jgi:hypothetical protein
MNKKFVCVNSFSYKHTYLNGRSLEGFFKKGDTYLINASYILNDRNYINPVHKNTMNEIFGYAPTVLIYRNFVDQDYVDRISSIFNRIISFDFKIENIDKAKSLLKN